MKLIALTGEMGAGKSTVIELLKEIQHSPMINIKFAEPLYSIQEYMYRAISPAYKRPETFIKDRKLLQWIGTEWGRNTIRESIWVDVWKNRVLSVPQNTLVTCDDVRFDNEAEIIKSINGIIIKVTSNANRIDKLSGINNHPSENGIDLKYVDCILDNSGTLEDLKQSLLTLNNNYHIW